MINKYSLLWRRLVTLAASCWGRWRGPHSPHCSGVKLISCVHTFHLKVGGGGGIEGRPGTEKRCSHNLQSGPVKTWTAVYVIINISIDDQLIRNSLQNLCLFCRGKVSGERLISHGTYCQFRTREYSMEATSMKTLLFSQCLVCCNGEWISCELCGSHVSLVYTWRPGLRQTFQS